MVPEPPPPPGSRGPSSPPWRSRSPRPPRAWAATPPTSTTRAVRSSASVTDASFTFDYRALGETVLTGEADNAKPAAKLHMEVQSSTYDAVLITDQLYTRVDGSEWEQQDVSAEDPRLAQGNPVKTVEYLSSSQDTAQSDCELRGTFDSELLLPDSGLPPLPFDATVAPDGHLVRLKVTVAGGDAVWTVSNWGEPRDITAPI